MFGNRNFKKGNRNNQNQTSSGVCICPKCGYSILHSKGIPCSTITCPTCKTGLIRSEISETINKTISEEALNQETQKPTPPTIIKPKVNPELCTGCGVCIDTCPNGAIILKDDKAFIEEDLCRNCKKCVRVCPSEAIN